MPFVSETPRPPRPHFCTVPDVSCKEHGPGTVWVCDDCGTYWAVHRFSSYSYVWEKMTAKEIKKFKKQT